MCSVPIENSVSRDHCLASLSKASWCQTVTLGTEFSIGTSHPCKILILSWVFRTKWAVIFNCTTPLWSFHCFHLENRLVMSSYRLLELKGKEHKNTNELCLNVFGKLHVLMQTGGNRILLKIMQFYVFKMAANGGHRFEINIKTENYKTQFISQKHANSCTFENCDVSFLCN